MKHCPECGRPFTDETLRFCLYDGKPLTDDAPPLNPAPLNPAPPNPAPLSSAAPPPGVPYTAPPPSAAYAGPPPQYAPPTQYAQPQYVPPGGMPPQKKSGWRWVGGVIGLLVFLRLVSHLGQPAAPPTGLPSGSKPADGTPPDSSPSNSSPSDSAVHESLVSAIRQADTAETQALSQGDPAPLYTAYTGPALAHELQALQKLKDIGVTVDGRLVSQDFGTFTVNSDRSTAQVDVTEIWSLTFYSAATRKTLRSTPADVVRQTISLKRGDNGWTIDDSHDKTQ